MKDQRALLKIREEFHKFSFQKPQGAGRYWSMLPREKNELLAHALRYLCEFMRIDRAAVFLHDERVRLRQGASSNGSCSRQTSQ